MKRFVVEDIDTGGRSEEVGMLLSAPSVHNAPELPVRLVQAVPWSLRLLWKQARKPGIWHDDRPDVLCLYGLDLKLLKQAALKTLGDSDT